MWKLHLLGVYCSGCACPRAAEASSGAGDGCWVLGQLLLYMGEATWAAGGTGVAVPSLIALRVQEGTFRMWLEQLVTAANPELEVPHSPPARQD